jgi:hypothetical protein
VASVSSTRWRVLHRHEPDGHSLRALATSLTAEQSNWVGGYFTGYADAVRLAGAALAPTVPQPPAPQPATQAAQRTLTVLYGSETGNVRTSSCTWRW